MIARYVVALALLFSLRSAPAIADDTTLLLLGDGQVQTLDLDIRLGDRSVSEAWDTAFDALAKFFDRNGDGLLDQAEAARLPTPFALRQTLWGQFALDFEVGGSPIKLGPDQRIDYAEVAARYRRQRIGNATVATGRAAMTARLNEALVRHLDVDRDGTISVGELRDARARLAPLDLNDDELLGPGEISRGVTSYPGTSGTVLVGAKSSATSGDAGRVSFPLPDGIKLAPESTQLAGKRLTVELPSDESLHAEWEPKEPSERWSTFGVAGLTLHLRRERGVLPERAREMVLAAETWYQRLDADRDGIVTAAEAEGPQKAAFRRSLAVADRDDDGRLSRAEYTAWLDVQSLVAEAQTLVTAIDFDRSLFEQLDADHDGGLSNRDLRTAPDRLAAAGYLVDGKLDLARLPRVLLATVSRGHPRSLLLGGARSGPSWFRAMDRNGDGDVSARESLLPKEQFDKLDADADGLLGPEEAAAKIAPK